MGLNGAFASTPQRCCSSPLAAGAPRSSISSPGEFWLASCGSAAQQLPVIAPGQPGRGGAVPIKQTPATKKNWSCECTEFAPPYRSALAVTDTGRGPRPRGLRVNLSSPRSAHHLPSLRASRYTHTSGCMCQYFRVPLGRQKTKCLRPFAMRRLRS